MPKTIFIGLGGIGQFLLYPVCQYLSAKTKRTTEVWLVDGKQYSQKNVSRQFSKAKTSAFKAYSKMVEMSQLFPKITFSAKPTFISKENVGEIIKDGDVVFLAVDNHSTRKLVSDYCQNFSTATIISGGNEEFEGNVQVYLRRNFKDITVPLTKYHPEIENPSPDDIDPSKMSCFELSQLPSGGQTIAANQMASTLMFNAFWMIENSRLDNLAETYFDVRTGNIQRFSRFA